MEAVTSEYECRTPEPTKDMKMIAQFHQPVTSTSTAPSESRGARSRPPVGETPTGLKSYPDLSPPSPLPSPLSCRSRVTQRRLPCLRGAAWRASLLFLAAITADARTIWVAPDAKPTGDGSRSDPAQLPVALQLANGPQGGTVNVMLLPGDYHVDPSDSRMTILRDGVRIQGAGKVRSDDQGRLDHLENGAVIHPTTASDGALFTVLANDVHFTDLTLDTIIDTPNGPERLPFAICFGIDPLSGAVPPSNLTGCELRDCDVKGGWLFALLGVGADLTVQHCRVGGADAAIFSYAAAARPGAAFRSSQLVVVDTSVRPVEAFGTSFPTKWGVYCVADWVSTDPNDVFTGGGMEARVVGNRLDGLYGGIACAPHDTEYTPQGAWSLNLTAVNNRLVDCTHGLRVRTDEGKFMPSCSCACDAGTSTVDIRIHLSGNSYGGTPVWTQNGTPRCWSTAEAAGFIDLERRSYTGFGPEDMGCGTFAQGVRLDLVDPARELTQGGHRFLYNTGPNVFTVNGVAYSGTGDSSGAPAPCTPGQ